MDKRANDYNSTRYLIPFFSEDKKVFQERFASSSKGWIEAKLSVKYLSKFVNELFRNDKDGICKKYYLSNEAYSQYGLPERFADIKLEASMPQVKGDFSFRISKIEQYLFNTGFGFLEIETTYLGATAEYIADISYCLANIFNNEHDNNEKKENRVIFMYGEDSKKFSLKNAIYNILGAEKGDLDLFPTSSRQRIFVYHNLIQNESSFNKSIIENLKKVLPSKTNTLIDASDYDYLPTKYQIWGMCSSGVVSVALKNSNNADFLYNVYKKNVYSDYFTAFLLAIYEREILLKYNHLVVKNHSNPKKLISLKPVILKLEMLFSYNTVSTESIYQEYYEKLYEVFRLENLEQDISDIIEKVDEYVSDKKERKINVLLSAVALLAIISVICDAIGIADRLVSPEPLGVPHLILFITVGIVMFVSTVVSLYRKKN